MELIKLDLVSKNNTKTGVYLYSPIVKVGNEYFRCGAIKANKKLKKSDIQLDTLVIFKKIEKEFYQANGIII